MPVTDCTTRRLGAGNHDRPTIVGSVMRHPLRAALLLAVVGLAACGDDRPPDAAATLPPPASTAPTGTSFPVATGPEDVVISVRQEGGFVPPGVVFAATPTAMVI